MLPPLSRARQAVRRGPEPGPGHGARAVRQRAVPRAEQAHPQEVQPAQGRGDRLQAGAGQRGAAADPAAGHQVQGGRHGEHQGDAGQRRQGEARIHRREGHQQDELTQTSLY